MRRDLALHESWLTRQNCMEAWYRDQGADPDRAVDALGYEYRPFADFLSELRGSVLDVGGGAGLASAHLHRSVRYVVLDPSPYWTSETWRGIRAALAPNGPEPRFVGGMGESMPFASASFDSATAFWSLNHVADPPQCVSELHRVLRPGGRALIVLEDMEPSWADVAKLAFRSKLGKRDWPTGWHQKNIATARATALHKLSGRAWPLQEDHVRIVGRELHAWFGKRFRTVRRSWPGDFLTYELVRI